MLAAAMIECYYPLQGLLDENLGYTRTSYLLINANTLEVAQYKLKIMRDLSDNFYQHYVSFSLHETERKAEILQGFGAYTHQTQIPIKADSILVP